MNKDGVAVVIEIHKGMFYIGTSKNGVVNKYFTADEETIVARANSSELKIVQREK